VPRSAGRARPAGADRRHPAGEPPRDRRRAGTRTTALPQPPTPGPSCPTRPPGVTDRPRTTDRAVPHQTSRGPQRSDAFPDVQTEPPSQHTTPPTSGYQARPCGPAAGDLTTAAAAHQDRRADAPDRPHRTSAGEVRPSQSSRTSGRLLSRGSARLRPGFAVAGYRCRDTQVPFEKSAGTS
jgi:hypothetical protein